MQLLSEARQPRQSGICVLELTIQARESTNIHACRTWSNVDREHHHTSITPLRVMEINRTVNILFSAI